jgi:aspartate ammonia-lyase
MPGVRIEKDILGEKEIPDHVLWGIHTARALENFPVSGRKIPNRLIHAYGEVKLACCRVNARLGYLDQHIADAIEKASLEMSQGLLDSHVCVDAFQGGAGTSTNLNVSEVLANRALQILGNKPGDYIVCDPFLQVNLHQSTNDTYPTALKVAAFRAFKELEAAVNHLQEAAQSKEREFSHIVKIGRTELMDAVPMTLGRTFGAWAEALSRDRWRLFKCTERIRVVNLGGTAIGTGLGAPRDFIFQASDELRTVTGLPLARAENLVDATQNLDVFVEVSGIVKAHAMNLLKISGDLRILSMGPDAGLAEIVLPALQAGSSIMPGKINPVIPELMAQVAIQVSALDQAITWAVGSGQLELNAFLPLIAVDLLESLELLIAVNRLAADFCLAGIRANEGRCLELVSRSLALTTALLPVAGYHKANEVARLMREEKISFEEASQRILGLTSEQCRALLSPEALNALGYVGKKG